MSEKRTFKMHPALLFSVIQSQAGTLSKGILESVMNSIDAGATKVEITLTDSSYTVKDDGKGFASRQEIESFFETFGTPHVEGDATYGRFRIGRGQGFAFAVNTWGTGIFEMQVDIKNKGLDYILKDNLEPYAGCFITGDLYAKLAPTDLLATQRTLIEQCLYTPIPVFLNGKQISKDATKEKWDHETEDAYIKLIGKSTMAVYNLGILVSNFSAYEFGTGGIVVSKKQLDLNFARNDVMRSTCAVWKRVKPFLKDLSDKTARRGKKVTEEWRHMKAQEFLGMLSGNQNDQDFYAVLREAIFTDISGKLFSFEQLASKKGITISKRGDFSADRVSQSKMALVLDQDLVQSRFGFEFPDLIQYILDKVEENNIPYKAFIEKISSAFKPLEFYTQSFKTEHQIIDPKALNKKEALALSCINNISDQLIGLVRDEKDLSSRTRKILPMKSEVADAFTDGEQTIWVHKKYLSGYSGPGRGFDWAYDIVNLMLHEYCHDFNSGVGHTHDSDFYQLFHDSAMKDNGLSRIVTELLRIYIKGASELTGKLSRSLGFQADQIHKAEEIETKINTQLNLSIEYTKKVA